MTPSEARARESREWLAKADEDLKWRSAAAPIRAATVRERCRRRDRAEVEIPRFRA